MAEAHLHSSSNSGVQVLILCSHSTVFLTCRACKLCHARPLTSFHAGRFLSWLCENGCYTKADLAGALSIAQQSIDELPNCALLSDYLPGPRYRCRMHARCSALPVAMPMLTAAFVPSASLGARLCLLTCWLRLLGQQSSDARNRMRDLYCFAAAQRV